MSLATSRTPHPLLSTFPGSLAAALAAAALIGPGCAWGPSPRASVRTTDFAVRTADFALLGAPTSNTEREARLDAADDDEGLNEKALTGAFWTGLIVGSVGAATAVGFGVGGAVTTRQLEQGYEDGLTATERGDLVDRGETFNALAITGATLAVTGLAVAAIAHGIDASRCGPRRRKKEKCEAR